MPELAALHFTLDDVAYAIALDQVVEVVRAATVVPVTGAPPLLDGLLDLRGEPVPVVDAFTRFGHPARPIAPEQRFIIARAGERTLALRVGAADAIVTIPDAAVEDPRRHIPADRAIAGVVALPDGLLLIHDAAAFLSEAEGAAIDRAVDAARGGGA